MKLSTGQGIQLKHNSKVVRGRLEEMWVGGGCKVAFGKISVRMPLKRVWEDQLRG